MPGNITSPLPNVHKIAVLRASALGDFLFALPAIGALRRTYPLAEIIYLGKPWHRQFIPGHVPAIDRVVIVPPYAGVGEAEDYANDASQLEAFFGKMRGEHIDLALQMHGGGRYSNIFTNQLGAALTIGSRSSDAEPLDRTIPFSFYQHEVLRCLELAGLAGATTDDIAPHITPSHKDIGAAQRLTGAARYVVIHPGASDPRRRWPIEKFVSVARHFINQNLAVFVTGDNTEQTLVNAVIQGTNGRARSAGGALDIGGLAALLARAAVTISNDTGPLHLARAVGCPTVGLYWCGNYITAGPVRLDRHRSFLSWTTACPQCHTPCVGTVPFSGGCNHQISFIQDIPTEQVIAAAQTISRRGQD